MSSNSYEFMSILQVQSKQEQTTESIDFDYSSLLESVRSIIAQNHAASLTAILANKKSEEELKILIAKYASEYMSGKEYNLEALTNSIFEDMASLGILTKYLHDPLVEEINVNGYGTIEIIYPQKTEYLLGDNAFPSAEVALALTKRMVRLGGMLLDAQTPRVDSYIGAGVRISAIIPPLVPEEYGVVLSIRKQIKSRITREQMIQSGSATADMLDFLLLCLCHGVSIGTAGGTGSGKTTLMSYLINEYILKNDDYNSRVYIIEDSRELSLIDYDTENNRPARVLYTVTKGPPNPVSMHDLIVSALRFNPNLIVPAEVRDSAAYQAAIAGGTGHTILTSFHADSAIDGYSRLSNMCSMSGINLTSDQFFKTCVKAWPIMIFQKQLKDNSRKIMEIFEATGYLNGEVQGTMLYRFEVEREERNESGKIIKVHGKHMRVGCISQRLYKRFRDNGAPKELLGRLFPDARRWEG